MIKREFLSYPKFTALSFDDLILFDGLEYERNSVSLLEKYDSIDILKYDSIIVDEGQDFDQYQAMIISLHLQSDDSEFRVFYDETQNIFDKDFKDGFDIKNEPFVLKENLRNTSSIYNWATKETKLGTDEITNQIIGPLPESTIYSDAYELANQLEIYIQQLVNEEKVSLKNIVVLVDHDIALNFYGKQIY